MIYIFNKTQTLINVTYICHNANNDTRTVERGDGFAQKSAHNTAAAIATTEIINEMKKRSATKNIG